MSYPTEDEWWTVRDRLEKIPRGVGGVYLVRHLGSGKCYIGATTNMRSRCNGHFSALAYGRIKHTARMRAEFEGSVVQMDFEPLVICASEHLELYEQRAIDVFKPELNTCSKSAYW